MSMMTFRSHRERLVHCNVRPSFLKMKVIAKDHNVQVNRYIANNEKDQLECKVMMWKFSFHLYK